MALTRGNETRIKVLAYYPKVVKRFIQMTPEYIVPLRDENA